MLVIFSLQSYSTFDLFPYLFSVYNKWKNVFPHRYVDTKGIKTLELVWTTTQSILLSLPIFLVLKTLYRAESLVRSVNDFFR